MLLNTKAILLISKWMQEDEWIVSIFPWCVAILRAHVCFWNEIFFGFSHSQLMILVCFQHQYYVCSCSTISNTKKKFWTRWTPQMVINEGKFKTRYAIRLFAIWWWVVVFVWIENECASVNTNYFWLLLWMVICKWVRNMFLEHFREWFGKR